tara:strand:+ start:305 stop:1204 length:900 start_codon:yes stop_codon:yes gene_type:complete
MYFPKSQIVTNLYTPGQEFVTVTDGLEYIGNYWKTSQGFYFTGTNPKDQNVQPLQRSLINDTPGGGALSNANDDLENYINLSPIVYQNVSGIPIIDKQTKINRVPFPTKTNYVNKNFQRYFLKRTNNFSYLETSKNIYSRIVDKDIEVQYEIYQPIQLTWRIKGKLLDVYKQNFNTVQYQGNLYNWVKFDLYFKNRYARYFRPDNDEPNYTAGGELKVERTNEEYIGFYHVHPNKGVLMEGKVHINAPHDILVLIKEGEKLSKKRIEVDDEVGTSRRMNVPSRRISPPRNVPSRGGGGY